MSTKKKIEACDCETDPFLHERVPAPFIWGLYDGKIFRYFHSTEEFVEAVKYRKIILYAHNGGKFDFMFLLPYIGTTKVQIIGGRIVSMFLGLCELRDSFSAVPQSLGSIQKKEIDYKKLEREVRQENMPEIIEYLKWDCIYLYDLMFKYRETAGKHKTIASNAMAFAKKQGIDSGKTNHRFDTKYRRFYYGGRTEVFNGGTHRDITIIDIRSAYPFAMLNDHPTGADWDRLGSLDGLTDDEISRCMIVIECMADGCFPLRIKGADGGLFFPKEYNEYYITGWEYLVARRYGLFTHDKILSVRMSQNKINFREYVEHWFAYKQSHNKHTNPIEYTIGKIMMNSLYGKLAQNPTKYFDYQILPAGTPVDDAHGWNLHTEFLNSEIHRRESMWKWKYELGVEWEGKALYNNVATASSITGFARAHLLRAIHIIGREHILYCDTDSLIVGPGADITRLPLTDEIGAWEIEAQNCPVGHFAGKKMYGIELPNGKHKIASKGGKLSFSGIERVTAGETVVWKNDAPSFSIDGSARFVVRKIRSTVR